MAGARTRANRSHDDSPIVKKPRTGGAAPPRRLAMVLDEAEDEEMPDEVTPQKSQESP